MPATRVRSVAGRFALIRATRGDSMAGGGVVCYDARRGFPRSAAIDPIKNAADDEIGWTIDGFG